MPYAWRRYADVMGRGIEKRKFQRLAIPLCVDVEIDTASDVPARMSAFPAKSRNISRNGICLETDFIEVCGIHLLAGPPGARDNRLQMKIPLFPEETLFTATGEVCWYDIAGEVNENIYRLGVEFIAVEDHGKEQLHRFLQIHKDRQKFFSQAAKKILHCIKPGG